LFGLQGPQMERCEPEKATFRVAFLRAVVAARQSLEGTNDWS
jgi:hypothetical protein